MFWYIVINQCSTRSSFKYFYLLDKTSLVNTKNIIYRTKHGISLTPKAPYHSLSWLSTSTLSYISHPSFCPVTVINTPPPKNIICVKGLSQYVLTHRLCFFKLWLHISRCILIQQIVITSIGHCVFLRICRLSTAVVFT